MSQALDEPIEVLEEASEFAFMLPGSRKPVLLGLDIGTSGVRAALFDDAGNEIPRAHVRLDSHTMGDAVAGCLSPYLLFRNITQAIDALLTEFDEANLRIELISISCFWHSLVGIDEHEHAITEVMGWSDARAHRAAAELRATLDEAKFHSRTGCRFHSSYWPAKLLRIRTEEPEVWARTKRWLSFGDYVALKLFGETATTVSMASGTGLFDQHICEWDQELVNVLQLRLETLPEIAAVRRSFENLNYEFAVRWPQLSQARLFPAVGDGAANNIGEGCVSSGQIVLMVGTSGAMRIVSEELPPASLDPALWCYRADRTRIVVGGALSDGGSLYNWIREKFLFGEDADSIEFQLSQLQPDSHRLTVLPFWLGERSPNWNMNARGGIFGVTVHTTPIEILRAAMEAVAYRFALVANAIDGFASNATVVASGHALRSSPTWAQIIADVLGRPITISERSEASTRGAALLALEAGGRIDTINDFSVSAAATFEPDMSNHKRYREGLKRQQTLYDRVVKQN